MKCMNAMEFRFSVSIFYGSGRRCRSNGWKLEYTGQIEYLVSFIQSVISGNQCTSFIRFLCILDFGVSVS